MKEQLEQSFEKIETTVGDLIEALTEVAQEAGKSDLESYQIASESLGRILSRNEIELDLGL